MLKIGDRLPAARLQEFVEVAGEACSVGPNTFETEPLAKGRTVAVFALPGAFTPTCSAQHVPGYVAAAEDLRAAGVDEVWCIAVNDAFVMGAWGREQQTAGKLRMMADGNAEFTRSAGLTLDLTARGLGLRSQRHSMLVVDGIVQTLNVEEPGQFKVSGADVLLQQARGLKR